MTDHFRELVNELEKAKTAADVDKVSTATLIGLFKGNITARQAEELRAQCEKKLKTQN